MHEGRKIVVPERKRGSFSLGFFKLPTPVIAHAQWENNAKTRKAPDVTLTLFTSRREAENFLSQLSGEPAERFREHVARLDPTGDKTARAAFTGVVAGAFSHRVAEYARLRENMELADKNKPEIFGMMEVPKKHTEVKAGALFWYLPTPHEYHVVIVHSKRQAEDVILELEKCFGKEARADLWSEVTRSHMIPRSSKSIQRIGGATAELLWKSAVYSEIMKNRRGQKSPIYD